MRTTTLLRKFDRKLFAFNAADSSRRTSDEFVLSGTPDGGIWVDGDTLWAMDSDGPLRAFNISRTDPNRSYGSEFENLRADLSPDGYLDRDRREVDAPRGIWSDGSTLWVVDNDTAKVFAFGLPGTPSCSRSDNYCRQSGKDFTLAADNDNPWGITAGRSTPTGEVDTWWVTNPHEDRAKDRKIFAYNRSDGSRNPALDIDLSQLDIINGQQYYYGLACHRHDHVCGGVHNRPDLFLQHARRVWTHRASIGVE